MKNALDFNINGTNVVQLLSEDELMDSEKEAFATILKNPAVTWAKFILTDDKPNGNKQRVPQAEFDNLIKTGIYMPVKMAFSKIMDGHEDSFPLGVITHLSKVGNVIKAIAAFWSRERPDDISMLKECIAGKKPVNVSWEILYGDSDEEEGGITALKDTILRGVTIVGMPAYEGRTPVLAVASKGSKAYTSKLSDESFLFIDGDKRIFPYKDIEGKIDVSLLQEAISSIPSYTDLSDENKQTLLNKANEILTTALAEQSEIDNKEDVELETIEELKEKVSTLEATIAEKDVAISESATKLAALEVENTELKEFKSAKEQETMITEKFSSIKQKFVDAGIEKPETYFEENKEKFLSLEESALDFLVQEMVAFAAEAKASLENKEDKGIPKINVEPPKKPTLTEMADYLKKNS